jgi:hypothetical protein
LNRVRLYLDTSVISHLQAEDTPFRHFVNIKTINKVQAVNKIMDYHEINILPPSMMIEGDER